MASIRAGLRNEICGFSITEMMVALVVLSVTAIVGTRVVLLLNDSDPVHAAGRTRAEIVSEIRKALHDTETLRSMIRRPANAFFAPCLVETAGTKCEADQPANRVHTVEMANALGQAKWGTASGKLDHDGIPETIVPRRFTHQGRPCETPSRQCLIEVFVAVRAECSHGHSTPCNAFEFIYWVRHAPEAPVPPGKARLSTVTNAQNPFRVEARALRAYVPPTPTPDATPSAPPVEGTSPLGKCTFRAIPFTTVSHPPDPGSELSRVAVACTKDFPLLVALRSQTGSDACRSFSETFPNPGGGFPTNGECSALLNSCPIPSALCEVTCCSL